MSEDALDVIAFAVANLLAVCCFVYSFLKSRKVAKVKASRLVVLFILIVTIEASATFVFFGYFGLSFSEAVTLKLILCVPLIAFIILMVSCMLVACDGSRICTSFLTGETRGGQSCKATGRGQAKKL
ncbi:MAG: hypothetical protein ACNA77_11235 [Opitutales bacterium]